MRSTLTLGLLWLLAIASSAQVTTSVLGAHDLGPGGSSPVVGGLPPCYFCHAPHGGMSGAQVGLWSQRLSTVQNYTLYPQSGITNLVQEPVLGDQSNLCLSCHDGTVAPGQTTPWGNIQMSGSMLSNDVFGRDLSAVHPFNFKLPLQMPADQSLLSSVVNSGTTANSSVVMPGGNIQCTTCHNAHVQSIDSSNAFLVVDNSSSGLCLACHVSSPAGSAMMARKPTGVSTNGGTARGGANIETRYNALTAWRQSSHAEAGNQAAKGANVGTYGTVRRNGCMSCHKPHNGQAGGALLSPAKHPLPNVDATTQTCLNCHNGGSTVAPAIANIYQEFMKKGHPFPTSNNSHSFNETTLLNKNRHATCTDCHNAHSSQKTSAFISTNIRPAQNGSTGISAVDGVTVVSPAQNQYEVCFRCHGASAGKQSLPLYGYLPPRVNTNGDPLNLIPQLSGNALSSHPVTHDRQSKYPQPSLLKFMWNLDGHTQGRVMGTRLLCTDCHNSDDNREFGGSGPSGPHGSQYYHILERRYEFSQVAAGAGPGSTIENLLPAVADSSPGGPYALCAKCHDLSNILSNASFRKHSVHINAGFSCSVCHTAHGVSAGSAGSSGERLVNFDIAVVGRNDSSEMPIAYNRAAGTCTLKCHNYNHNQDGSVTSSQGKPRPRMAGH